jgi:hypothetical protein
MRQSPGRLPGTLDLLFLTVLREVVLKRRPFDGLIVDECVEAEPA